jgi:hypothetical protein
MTPSPGPEYRVVEVSVVTEDELSRVLNDNVREGWIFDGFQFVMREASRRPAMAFALFRRPPPAGEGSSP